MTAEREADTTALLQDWSGGDSSAFDALFPRVYEELRSLAHQRLTRNAPDQTVSTTVLVHEAYLKLVDADRVRVGDRAHFLAVASRAMRFILVDRARERAALKRGGGRQAMTLDEERLASADEASADLIALDQALDRLARHDEDLVRVVEHRFFGGMEYAEIAEVMGLSVSTTKRYWARARHWLHEFMTDGED